jgi:hypothetical protein
MEYSHHPQYTESLLACIFSNRWFKGKVPLSASNVYGRTMLTYNNQREKLTRINQLTLITLKSHQLGHQLRIMIESNYTNIRCTLYFIWLSRMCHTCNIKTWPRSLTPSLWCALSLYPGVRTAVPSPPGESNSGLMVPIQSSTLNHALSDSPTRYLILSDRRSFWHCYWIWIIWYDYKM